MTTCNANDPIQAENAEQTASETASESVNETSDQAQQPNLADAFKELTNQLEKTAKTIGEQFSAAAKKVDEHVNSEAFQQKTEKLKKAADDLLEKAADGAAKGTVLVSEGISAVTGSVLNGLKKTISAVQEAFTDSDDASKEETANQSDESCTIDVEWKEDAETSSQAEDSPANQNE